MQATGIMLLYHATTSFALRLRPTERVTSPLPYLRACHHLIAAHKASVLSLTRDCYTSSYLLTELSPQDHPQ